MKRHTSKLDVVRAKSNHSTHTDSNTLTAKEQTEFEHLEKQITENFQSVYTLAAALAQIRDNKLYRVKHKTFEEYCRKRWEYSRSYCLRLCDMNDVVMDLAKYKDSAVYPHNEVQARVFVNLEKGERIKLAEAVLKGPNEDRLTASVFSRFKKKLFPEKCACEPKKANPVIDVESSVTQMPDPPSLIKVVKSVEKTLQNLADEGCDAGEMADLLRGFIKEAKPWVAWEKQQKASK